MGVNSTQGCWEDYWVGSAWLGVRVLEGTQVGGCVQKGSSPAGRLLGAGLQGPGRVPGRWTRAHRGMRWPGPDPVTGAGPASGQRMAPTPSPRRPQQLRLLGCMVGWGEVEEQWKGQVGLSQGQAQRVLPESLGTGVIVYCSSSGELSRLPAICLSARLSLSSPHLSVQWRRPPPNSITTDLLSGWC